MKYKLLIIAFLFSTLANSVFAETPTIALEKVRTNFHDIESIKRGAKFFSTTCMACHTLVYMRYNKLAEEQGVTYAKMPVNSKITYFGAKPPDLSLVTRVRGSDWVYTYLHSFYTDPKQASGFNNLVLANSAMPNILAGLQGTQVLVDVTDSKLIYGNNHQWYDLLLLTKPGSMTPAQFDATITDVVNFLEYAAEPHKAEQQYLGFWVIGFLIVFFIFAYCLKQEYWKDVKKHSE